MTDQHLEHSIFGHDEENPTRRARRRRPGNGKGSRRWITLLVAVVLVAVASIAAVTVLRPLLSSLTGIGGSSKTDYAGPGTGNVSFTIKSGDTGESIATNLKAAGVVLTRTAYLEASAADPAATARIQPGTYALKKEMKAVDAFKILIDPVNRTNPRVTIPEGLWASEIFARLSQATGVPVANYTAAAKNPSALKLPASAKGNVEGYLFPATYEFPDKATAQQQLTIMVAKSVEELTKAGVAEPQMERIMTIASIVEGEVNGDADRGKVARVILNRLKGGPPNYGLLQMDSTVHYAVQKRGRAGTSAADRNSTSPYNTYKVQGLPPGPINSPGAASINAAAHPTPGPWLFFVTVDPIKGTTKFATTQAEHDRNVQEFNAWCAANRDQC